MYLVIEIEVNGADWLEDVNRRNRVCVFAEPRVEQGSVVHTVFHDSVHQLEVLRWDDRRDGTVAVLLTKENLRRKQKAF